MFFVIKKISGKPYLYKLSSKRVGKKKQPRHQDSSYIGAVNKVEKAITRWREKNE